MFKTLSKRTTLNLLRLVYLVFVLFFINLVYLGIFNLGIVFFGILLVLVAYIDILDRKEYAQEFTVSEVFTFKGEK